MPGTAGATHYPQAAFPYENLLEENGRRGKFDPEYELMDTGVFDGDRYWIIEVHYAKADPGDLLMPLDAIAADLQDRLISIFTAGPDGRRPCFGGVERLQHDPAWKDNIVFSEYFHGDNAAGIGAAHQTGWTGVIADLIRRRHGAVRAIGDVVRDLPEGGRSSDRHGGRCP